MDRSRSTGQKIVVGVCSFQQRDKRNFIYLCNNVSYFETAGVEVYFSIVDVGLFFKDYAILALKVKKGVTAYEVAIADCLRTTGSLLPLEEVPIFEKLRRLDGRQFLSSNEKRIKIKFQDGQKWRLGMCNTDLIENWVLMLRLASNQDKSFQQNSFIKRLKRNYESDTWHRQNPHSISNLFQTRLDVSQSFMGEIEKTKKYMGVNPDELIGRYLCEKKDKLALKEKLEADNKEKRFYEITRLEIENLIDSTIQ